MRKVVLVVAAAAAAGFAAWRRGSRPGEHVDLYYADGSMVSLVAEGERASRLLPLARDVLAAART